MTTVQKPTSPARFTPEYNRLQVERMRLKALAATGRAPALTPQEAEEVKAGDAITYETLVKMNRSQVEALTEKQVREIASSMGPDEYRTLGIGNLLAPWTVARGLTTQLPALVAAGRATFPGEAREKRKTSVPPALAKAYEKATEISEGGAKVEMVPFEVITKDGGKITEYRQRVIRGEPKVIIEPGVKLTPEKMKGFDLVPGQWPQSVVGGAMGAVSQLASEGKDEAAYYTWQWLRDPTDENRQKASRAIQEAYKGTFWEKVPNWKPDTALTSLITINIARAQAPIAQAGAMLAIKKFEASQLKKTYEAQGLKVIGTGEKVEEKLPDGKVETKWKLDTVDKKWYDSLPPAQKRELDKIGSREFMTKHFVLIGSGPDKGQHVDREFWEGLNPHMKKVALDDGVSALSLEGLTDDKQFEKLQQWGVIPKDVVYLGQDKKGNFLYGPPPLEYPDKPPEGWKWEKEYAFEPGGERSTAGPRAEVVGHKLVPEEKGTPLGILKGLGMATVAAIPVVGTVVYWDRMATPWKAASIALDALIFVAPVKMLSAGARAGVSMPRNLCRMAIAEVKAPVTMLRHPVQTTKSALEPFETLLRPGKLPLTSLEIREATVRIPVRDIGSGKAAKAARDELTRLAELGAWPALEYGGKTVQLTPTALQQTVGAAAVHSTPDIRAFLGGCTVQEGREGGLFLSPSLHTRFTAASAFGEVPKGNIPGAIIITDEKILAKLTSSDKLYRSTAEIESLLKAGVKLPPPSQTLITRDISGKTLTLLIIGKPLTKAQLAKLKFIGSKDLIRDIFAPAYKIKGKGIDDLAELGSEAKALEKELAAAKGAGRTEDVARLERELGGLNERARRLAREIDVRYAGRGNISPIGLARGDFLEEIASRNYARTDPEGFARFLRDMPRADRERVLAGLTSPQRIRIKRESRRVRGEAPRVYRGLGTVRTPTERPARVPERVPPPLRVQPPSRRVPPPSKGAPPPSPVVTPPGVATTKGKVRAPVGSVTWRQGIVWWTIKPPYRGKQDILHTRYPPPGAKVVKGPSSAYKTIQSLGAKEVPAEILLDMGIMDVTISQKAGKIAYSRDVKQKTKLGVKAKGIPATLGGIKR